ncbi:MAG: class I SAM-dependent methyltransferase [Syntrophobacteraceae bacterium]
MKLNWAERWVVNNPLRVLEQSAQVRWMKGVAPLEPGARVLEVGCGRGAGASLVLEAFEPESVFATDLDVEMIRKARRYLTASQKVPIQLATADASSLPFRSTAFDAVFVFGVLHHVPDWRSGLAEIARVLKPGGLLYIEELYPTLYQNCITRHILLHPTEDRFGSADFKSALQAQGFSFVGMREVKLVGILAVLRKTA